MKVLTKEFSMGGVDESITIVPIGDVHIGHKACNEARLKEIVNRVKNDPNCYWIGLGDYADFINVSDKRFDPESLANWITVSNLSDISKAQKEKFLSYIEPIANKCLGLIQGNHEEAIQRKYERDIYLEIVAGVKELGKIQESLALFYNGWMLLRFTDPSGKTYSIKLSLHHGFVGGGSAGSKANAMQKWLWTHDCDIAIFGHSHNTGVQIEAIERLHSRSSKVESVKRYGCYAGSFLGNFNQNGPSMYSERKGYMPLGMGGIEINLKPFANRREDRISIITRIG